MLEIENGEENDPAAYEVLVFVPADNKIMEVDAYTGEILEIEVSDEDNDSDSDSDGSETP